MYRLSRVSRLVFIDARRWVYYNTIIMQRKLIKVGTSVGVIIPKAILDEQKMKIGDIIHVEVSKKAHERTHPTIDPKLIQWTEEFIEEYRPLLKKLARS